MSLRIRLHPAAVHELAQAKRRYDLESSGLGERFLDDFERTALRIKTMPHSSPAARRGTRRAQLAKFPYSVVYRCDEEIAYVLAVAHNRRRPFYWKKRD